MKDRKSMVMIILIGITISLFLCCNSTVFATTGIVATSNLRLRKEESTSSEILTLLDENDKVEIISENGDWYKIKSKDKVGYVNKQYIKVEGGNNTTNTNNENTTNEITNTNTVNENNNENTTNNANNSPDQTASENKDNQDNAKKLKKGAISTESQIRIIPLINGDIINTAKPGEKYEIISNVGLWSYIKNEEKCGWILKDKLSITEENISDNKENATNNENLTSEGNDETVKPNENNSEEDKKEEKKDDKKEETKTETSTEKKYSKSKTYYISATSVNVRSEANKSSSVIKKLSKNKQVTVTGEDGDWYVIDLDGKKAYVSKEFLSSKKVETTSRSSTSLDEEKGKSSQDEPKEENSNPPSNSSGDAIVTYAKKFLGYKYVYGTNGPNTFDCSGFVQYVYKHFGYSLSRSSKTQVNDGVAVSRNNLQPGDIIIFKNTAKTAIGHVGIYIGNNQFIHASNSRTGVIISSLSTSAYQQRYVTARRIL